ncbi:MAG: zinc metallopeptidase [Clostridia bacterium]|nr:zinc metallopeptidase [Clostridia bacterium]
MVGETYIYSYGFWDIFQYFGYFFVLIAALASLIVSANVKLTFRKWSKYPTRPGLTGAESARLVLQANGVSGVRIAPCSGELTDHFDPRDNTVYLSETVFDKATAAAVGVAAHEAGHAVQHAQAYGPIKLRQAIIPATNIGSRLSTPLIIAGLVFPAVYPLALIGVFLFGLCVVFQLVTLPVEFNASRRAVQCLSSNGILAGDELKGAKKTLTAAALTYVAALSVALLQFLRLLAIVSGGRRRR